MASFYVVVVDPQQGAAAVDAAVAEFAQSGGAEHIVYRDIDAKGRVYLYPAAKKSMVAEALDSVLQPVCRRVVHVLVKRSETLEVSGWSTGETLAAVWPTEGDAHQKLAAFLGVSDGDVPPDAHWLLPEEVLGDLAPICGLDLHRLERGARAARVEGVTRYGPSTAEHPPPPPSADARAVVESVRGPRHFRAARPFRLTLRIDAAGSLPPLTLSPTGSLMGARVVQHLNDVRVAGDGSAELALDAVRVDAPTDEDRVMGDRRLLVEVQLDVKGIEEQAELNYAVTDAGITILIAQAEDADA